MNKSARDIHKFAARILSELGVSATTEALERAVSNALTNEHRLVTPLEYAPADTVTPEYPSAPDAERGSLRLKALSRFDDAEDLGRNGIELEFRRVQAPPRKASEIPQYAVDWLLERCTDRPLSYFLYMLASEWPGIRLPVTLPKRSGRTDTPPHELANVDLILELGRVLDQRAMVNSRESAREAQIRQYEDKLQIEGFHRAVALALAEQEPYVLLLLSEVHIGDYWEQPFPIEWQYHELDSDVE